MMGREMVDYVAFVRRKQSGEWKGSERLYEGSRAGYG